MRYRWSLDLIKQLDLIKFKKFIKNFWISLFPFSWIFPINSMIFTNFMRGLDCGANVYSFDGKEERNFWFFSANPLIFEYFYKSLKHFSEFWKLPGIFEHFKKLSNVSGNFGEFLESGFYRRQEFCGVSSPRFPGIMQKSNQ